MYGQGLDWTYGHYTRAFLRERLERRLPRALLQEAAEARAQSEAGSTGAAVSCGATPAPSVDAVAERCRAASPTPSTAAMAPATAEAEPTGAETVDASVATGLGRAAAVRQQMEAEAEALLAARQQQQQAQPGAVEVPSEAAAEDAPDLLSPAARKPLAAVGGDGAASEAPAVPTPEGQPLTEDRALTVGGCTQGGACLVGR